MKKVLVTALAVMATLSIYAQGTVNFSNIGGPKVKVDTGTVVDAPVGSTYQVGLFWAPLGTTDESVFQQVGTAANIGPVAGLFSGGTKQIDSIAAGAQVSLQVRGWNTAGTMAGRSAIFAVDTADPTKSPAEPIPGILGTGFNGLTISVVPEPSTIALGLLGLAGLFVIRRRN